MSEMTTDSKAEYTGEFSHKFREEIDLTSALQNSGISNATLEMAALWLEHARRDAPEGTDCSEIVLRSALACLATARSVTSLNVTFWSADELVKPVHREISRRIRAISPMLNRREREYEANMLLRSILSEVVALRVSSGTDA